MSRLYSDNLEKASTAVIPSKNEKKDLLDEKDYFGDEQGSDPHSVFHLPTPRFVIAEVSSSR